MGNRPPDAIAHSAALPLVAHLVERLDTAAPSLLELVEHSPAGRYRHAVVCLGGHSALHAELRERGVEVVDVARRAGPGFYLALYRTLRAMAPDLVHTRNAGNLDGQLVAALAGVRWRVHGEYPRDGRRQPGAEVCAGLFGAARRKAARRLRMQLLRRACCPLVNHYIAAGAEQERWLIEAIGAAPSRVTRILAGVDSLHYHPRLGPHTAVGPAGFMRDEVFVIGSVGRMDEVKDYPTLVEAFLRLIASPHPAHQRMRLMIVGDGPQRALCLDMLTRAGASHRAWLPGERSDIAQLLRAMDLFVLPSLAEGSSNTILEAMASGLPVVATAVGGNPVLVHPGFTGILVPPRTPDLMAAAIADYCRIPDMGARHGMRARSQVIARHSLPDMARGYTAVYDALTRQGTACPPAGPPP